MQQQSLRLLLLLYWTLAIDATRPGIVIRVNNKGLEYMDSVGIPVLIRKLKTTTIKDISGETHTPIGKIAYELKNVRNTGVSLSSSSFKTVPGVGLGLQATGIYVSFSGDWHYRKVHWPHISDSGSFDVSASGISFNLAVRLGEQQGHPTISAASCSADISDLNVKFHGGASWLYNLFRGKIADSLKGQLKDIICSEATKAINNDAEQELSSFPVRQKIDRFAVIDYSLIQSPLFEEDYMNISIKGEFLSAMHPTEASFQPDEIPGIQPCSKMICLYLTDYVGNTAGDIFYKGGFFNKTINASQVPKSSKYQLNTTIFKKVGLSRLYNMYPNQALQLSLYCTEPPQMNTQSTGVNIVISGVVEVYVVLKDNSTKFLFSLATNITGTGEAQVNGTILQGSVSKFWVEFSVAKSSVGNIKPNIVLLNLYLHFLAQNTIIKELNERGKKGLSLPVIDNTQLVDTKILLGKHFISLDTDVKYVSRSRMSNHIPILT